MGSQKEFPGILHRKVSAFDYNHHDFRDPLTQPQKMPAWLSKQLPTPFTPTAHHPDTLVKRETQPCANLVAPIKATGPKRPVTCDHCNEIWHLVCCGLTREVPHCGASLLVNMPPALICGLPPMCGRLTTPIPLTSLPLFDDCL